MLSTNSSCCSIFKDQVFAVPPNSRLVRQPCYYSITFSVCQYLFEKFFQLFSGFFKRTFASFCYCLPDSLSSIPHHSPFVNTFFQTFFTLLLWTTICHFIQFPLGYFVYYHHQLISCAPYPFLLLYNIVHNPCFFHKTVDKLHSMFYNRINDHRSPTLFGRRMRK